MLVLVTLMIASLGSLIIGSATSSTDTSRLPCQVTAFIPASWLTPVIARQMRAGLWSHLQHASVHHPRCAGHVTGLRACQECNHSCDFASITGSPERDTEPFFLVWILIFLTGHRGSDLAGRDGVRGNAVLSELECEGLDQSADAVLGGVVRPGADARLMLVNAGDRDEPAAVAGLHHVLRGLPHADEGAVQIGRDDLAPV